VLKYAWNLLSGLLSYIYNIDFIYQLAPMFIDPPVVALGTSRQAGTSTKPWECQEAAWWRKSFGRKGGRFEDGGYFQSKVVSTHLWNTPLNKYQQAIKGPFIVG